MFDLTHDVKLTCDMGELVPILCMETIPGDKFNISCESLLRFSPLVSPVMHRYDVTMHYFFVPNRILWDGWEKWIVGEHPDQAEAFPVLPFSVDSSTNGRLGNYLGLPRLPLGHAGGANINALPFAAYLAVYNEYYRDQNLISEIDYKLANGYQDNSKWTTLRRRAWEHDYFTAALPWAQKGTAVEIPIATGTVVAKQPGAGGFPTTPGMFRLSTTGSSAIVGGALSAPPGSVQAGGQDLYYDPNGSLTVESATPTTINDLRRAFRLQEWLEKNARGGTRYIENMYVHFGVKSSDARLQRPEYITGTKSPVVISEVLNTAGDMDGSGLPQGNMAGHAISVTGGYTEDYFCEEHGWIIGIMSVLPRTAYQQGVPRHFDKTLDQFQYFWPEFAHIGEQEVYNREIYFGDNNNSGTFGYVPRYAEYKYMPSRVCGDFVDSLDFWHHGRIFDTPPALNQAFVECNPDKRIFAVTEPNVNSLYVQILNKISAVRPMPYFGTPTF